MVKIVIISDTHGSHAEIKIPDADILIHAGDFSRYGSTEELWQFDKFLSKLPHKTKILIAGNHDYCFEREPDISAGLVKHFIYLQDSSVTIDGIKFYGSPWQPWFLDWAFNLERGSEIGEKWKLIDKDTDVLITHGPPLGYGDKLISGESVGCEELIKFVDEIKPTYHIFGHIHEGYGISKNEHTIFVNGCTCDIRYQPVNLPIVINI